MAMISPRDLYLRQHPELAERIGDSDRRRQFLNNHPGIATGWQRVRSATRPTLRDPRTPMTPQVSTVQDETVRASNAAAELTGYDALSAGDRDWVDALQRIFGDNGLGSLAGTLTGLVQGGHAGAALTVALQGSDEYRRRFAANDARKKAGLGVLSPSEYLATERQYRQVMQTAGLPAGFYDDESDFQRFLENDTSVAEVNDRVQGAVSLAKQTDSGYRKMLSEEFGVGLTDGDIAAYLLDQKRALPILQRFVQSVGIADAARRQGLTYSEQRASQLAELGVTGDQAQQSYGQIAQATGAYGRVGDAFGGDYTQTDAENEALLSDSGARTERESLDATFKGYNPGAASKKSSKALSEDTTGSY